MDQAYVDHLAENPQAGRARPRGPVVVANPIDQAKQKSATVLNQERILRRAEREKYEKDTAVARSFGRDLPPFVCSLDAEPVETVKPGLEADYEPAASGNTESPPPVELTPAQKAARTKAAKKAAQAELEAQAKEEAETAGDDGQAATADAFEALSKAQEGDK